MKNLLCFIPGGPGFPSETLGDLSLFEERFEVIKLEPPTLGALSFSGVVDALEARLAGLGRSVVLCGHSFGGLYATEIVARGKVPVQAWVGLATCVLAETLNKMGAAAAQVETPATTAAKERFYKTPTDANFKAWVGTLTAIYFSPPVAAGHALLQGSALSARAFLEIFQSVAGHSVFSDGVEKLRQFQGGKFLIAGEKDLLFSPSIVHADAAAVGARLITIPGASHFVTVDAPQALLEALAKATLP